MVRKGLSKRLSRMLLLQVVFISVATVLGVYIAKTVLEDVLIRQALADESAYFWEQHLGNPDFPLPDTRNLTGFMDQVPEQLRKLQPGFYNLQDSDSQLVMVSENGGERLYLVYDGRRVNELAIYFGLAPLVLVLFVLYLSSWLGFRASQRAISPVISLAREVQELDPENPDPAAFDPRRPGATGDDEVSVLTEAIFRFTTRLNEFVARERNFTRDASHELRSPLTVIDMAAQLLTEDASLSAAAKRSVGRIRRAARDMEELIAAFLLLAREDATGLPSTEVDINELVRNELERARSQAADKPVAAAIDERCRLFVTAPQRVLSVMIGNLLRNAFSYTDEGSVEVVIEPGRVTIGDSGAGMSAEQLDHVYQPFFRGDGARRGGHGVGLTIVRRLSDRFEWPVSMDSEPGVGTRVVISYPGARVEPLQRASAGACTEP